MTVNEETITSVRARPGLPEEAFLRLLACDVYHARGAHGSKRPRAIGPCVKWAPGIPIETGRKRLIQNLEAELFDNGIGQDFSGDLFHLFLCFFTVRAFEFQNEEFPLPHIFDVRVAQRCQRALDGLSLRIEHRRFQHDPNVSCHPYRCLPFRCSIARLARVFIELSYRTSPAVVARRS